MKIPKTKRFIALFFCLLISVFLVSGSFKAHAAPQPLPFNFPVPEFGDLLWDEIQDISICTQNDAPALNIDDATDADGNEDAYDNAWVTFIDGTPIAPAGTGDLTGSTYTAAPQNIAGLDATYQLFFSQDTQCSRFVLFLDNNTSGPISETVRITTNFGSDEDTQLEGTSSGDLFFTTADRWLVTSDDGEEGDPVLTNVLYGPGNPRATTDFAVMEHCDPEVDRNDGFIVDFDVTVPQNQSRCLMLFGCLANITGFGNTVVGALSDATLFNSNDTIPGDLLSGLTDVQLSECVNWDFPDPRAKAIPTLSEWGLLAMAGLIGIAGILFYRKRAVRV